MKIDSSLTTTTKISETRSRPAVSKTDAGSAAEVHLSSLAAQLQSTNETSTFDAARVAEIKQAITDGQFTINAGAIADRLIASAKELVNKPSN